MVFNVNRAANRSDSLDMEAISKLNTQQALLESSTIEQNYQNQLEVFVIQLHEQVERIEDKLESLFEQQQSKLQRLMNSQPGFMSMPSTKRAWQQQQQKQKAAINRIQGRLEHVRDIRDGMGLHTPIVTEMATRKLRFKNPELAKSFDLAREAARKHQAEKRKKELEKKKILERSRSKKRSRSISD